MADETSMETNLRLSADLVKDDPVEDTGPVYRVFQGTRIPVSKAMGCLWESRIKQAGVARKDIEDAWSEAIRYYEHDQSKHRSGGEGENRSARRYSRFLDDDWCETENVVFSNATTMLPMLYAKNPEIECTPTITTPENEAFVKCAERLVNVLLNQKHAPGINLKSKARRGVLIAYLCNSAYLKVGWTEKQDSSEQAMTTLMELSSELSKAKTKKEIEEVEGKIMALEQTIDLLTPTGPTAQLILPFRIFVDPASREPDHTDARWMAEYDFIPTQMLNAVYGKKTEDGFASVYEPTHILRANTDAQSIEDEVNNFSLFKSSDSARKEYGYATDAAFEAAKYTKVWYVWDKTTRRVYLFSDNSWHWPIWVWDDPLKLLGFFPYSRLWFHETPDGSQPKGEVTYYLDQQDSINDINSHVKRCRDWISRNIFYNKDVIKDEKAIEDVLKGPDGTARGVSVPEGTKLNDHIYSFAPPILQVPELLSTDTRFAAINRLTGINDSLRGAQFKTNTNTTAINTYQQNVDIRVDEKVDAIEDWLGDFAFNLLQILCQRMDAEAVADIVGTEVAAAWKNATTPQELRSLLDVRVIGGSTDKPTSQAKQQMALQTGQVMGQFAAQIPAAGLVILRMIERAFPHVIITDEDWALIKQSMQQPQGQEGQSQGGNEQEQVAQLIEQLPPEGKQMLQQLVQEGVNPTQALEQVMTQLQQTQPIQ